MDPRLTPYHWWGDAWAERFPCTLDELIGLGVVSDGGAALLADHVRGGGSIVICSAQSQLGKSTLAHALIAYVPDARTRIFVRGNHELFGWADSIAMSSTTLLVNEISDALPVYTWGIAARRCLELGAGGAQIIATAHATSARDLIEQLSAPDVGARAQHVVALGIVVVLDYRPHQNPGLGRVSTIELAPDRHDTRGHAAGDRLPASLDR